MNDNRKEIAFLYKHVDADPRTVMGDIKDAFSITCDNWVKSRPMKVASLLCAIAPAVIVPCDSRLLYRGEVCYYPSDIEYLYDVILDLTWSGSPIWDVDVYTPMAGFWDTPVFTNLKYSGVSEELC